MFALNVEAIPIYQDNITILYLETTKFIFKGKDVDRAEAIVSLSENRIRREHRNVVLDLSTPVGVAYRR